MYFGVEESGIGVCLVAAVNGAGVNKKTNITYVPGHRLRIEHHLRLFQQMQKVIQFGYRVFKHPKIEQIGLECCPHSQGL